MSKLQTIRLKDPDASLGETLSVLRTQRLQRRRVLGVLAGLGFAGAVPAQAFAACSVIPSETGGPYPGDGTNGPNVLTSSGIVRSDIGASFGSAGTTAVSGTPMTLTLTLVNTANNCAPLEGFAIYLWHCDNQGRYSLYSSGVTTQNFLRGVQVTDANGQVTFTTIVPGCYDGRWPHIHFEIYQDTAHATSGGNALKTSQLAIPEATCREVYANTSLYPSSLTNLGRVSLASDMVFADGVGSQLPTVTGTTSAGYTMALQVGISTTIASTSSAPSIAQAGLTGLWYEPASAGQGLAIEVIETSSTQGYVQGGWFTFDVAPAGGVDKQRWYSFGGAVAAGASSATMPIYVNTGGNFNTTPITTAQQVGTCTIAFTSCTAATFTYVFSDGTGRSGTIPLSRLLSSVTCSTGSTRPTSADFSLSGNFYNPATSGQGFVIEVNPSAPALFFAWYTYAVASALPSGSNTQRWYTGQAAFAAGQRAFVVTLYETTGGAFDTDKLASQATAAVGTATLTFAGCNGATLAFAFSGGGNAGQSGTIALSRLGTTPPGCSA